MDRDLTQREDRATPPDDAELGDLVRAVAEDWHRPPQRLDQPTWRERVDVSRRGHRSSTGRRWFGRLAEAGVLAVVATVVLALGAVFLTSPSRNGNIGSNPSTTPTEGASPTGLGSTPSVAPVASPLPALFVNGQLPSVTSVLLQGSGGYRLADLTTGTLGADMPWDVNGWNTPVERPGGGWVCVCSTFRAGATRGSEQLVIALRAVDAAGAAAGDAELRTLRSSLDPSQPATDSQTLDVRTYTSPDGRYAFIGWSVRDGKGWHSGVEVVDLATLQVVDSLALPDATPTLTGGQTWVRFAPLVHTAVGVDLAIITSNWWVEDPASADPPQGTDRWSAPFSAGSLGDLDSAGSRTDADCYEWEHGLVDADMFYVACIGNGSGAVRVERYDLTGTEIDRTEVGQFTGFGAFAARPDHRLFLWDPQSHTLMTYDLQTGRSSVLRVPDTAVLESPSDILSAIGRTVGSWLAPTTTAKILLQPAIAVSADGTRLYALGIEASPSELGGSAGVFAFDISGDTLALVGHWPPNADYVSLAVSEDGAFVYAAGMGGVDADGLEAPDVKPSVTVFDATDGSIRLIAGQLDGREQLFVTPVVR